MDTQEQIQQLRVLVVSVRSTPVEALRKILEPHMRDEHSDFVTNLEQYQALTDPYSYEILVVQFGGPFMKHVLDDQTQNNKNLKWVQALTAGIDAYTPASHFVESPLPLTCVRGAFSAVLGEFVAMGMLYFAKQMPAFLESQQHSLWKQETVELVSNKVMAIVGYGDIGAACGKLVRPFGTKVIGIKRRPEIQNEEQKAHADQIVGMDQLDSVLAQADYVVGVLPKTDVTYHYFNKEFYKKMKPSAIFMNIGRGPTHKEVDLIEALKAKTIAGAVLDVFEVEPLAKDSELWGMKNVIMTAHSADIDSGYLDRAMQKFGENLKNYK